MLDVLKIHSKSYIRDIPYGNWQEHEGPTISYDSSVGGRDGRRPLPKSMMKRFLSLVAGFGFTLLLLPMTASET